MTKVKCDMTECKHNKEEVCTKDEIELIAIIEGSMWCIMEEHNG